MTGESDTSNTGGEETTAGTTTEVSQEPPPLNGLTSLAEQGLLQLENGAAYEAASFLTYAIDGVNAVKRYSSEHAYLGRSMSSLTSGSALRDKADAAAVDFFVGLGKVDEILRGLRDLFVAAGQAYEQAEEVSTMGFGDLPDPAPYQYYAGSGSPYGGFDSLFPGASYTPGPSAELDSPPDRLLGYTESHPPAGLSSASINFEDKQYMCYLPLYELGEYLRNNSIPESTWELARVWPVMANALRSVNRELLENLTNMTAANWKGDGAAAGLGAVSTAVTDIESLPLAADAMGDFWSYVANSLHNTRDTMPTERFEPTKRDWSWQALWYEEVVDDAAIDGYRDAFEEHYRSKLSVADGIVPVMPELRSRLDGDFPATPTNPTDTQFDPNLQTGPFPSGGGDLPVDNSVARSNVSASDGLWSPQDQQQADPSPGTQPAQQDTTQRPSAQPGLSAAADLVKQGLTSAQQALESALQATDSNPNGLPTTNPLSTVPTSGTPLSNPLTGSRASGAGAAPWTGSSNPKALAEASKLFPRASVTGSELATLRTAAPGTQSQTMGSPGASGSPGAAGRGQQDEGRKRPTYLESTEHLDEAIGTALDTTRPVAGAAPTRPEPGRAPAVPVVVPTTDPQPAPVAPPPQRPAPQTVPAR